MSSQQFTEHAKTNLDWDFRLQPSTQTRSRAGLYSGALTFRTGLAPGWNVEINGDRLTNGYYPLPSSSSFIVQKAVVEKEWSNQRMQLGVVRLPFGIHDQKETYASGLIAYPLARSDHGLTSVDWGVPGGKWNGGPAAFQIEAAAFDGHSAGIWGNIGNVGGTAVRTQTYVPNLIFGVSRWDGYLSLPTAAPTPYRSGIQHRAVHINGIDVRYTRPHLLLRGEVLFGVLGGASMDGWYLDAYYHLPKYQRITLAARIEAFRPIAGGPYGRQLTIGARYILAPDWMLAVNWRRNNLSSAYSYSWTPYSGSGGSLLLQVYHKMQF